MKKTVVNSQSRVVGYRHMKRKNWYAILIILALLIGGYFAAAKTGFFGKKTIEYSKQPSVQELTGGAAQEATSEDIQIENGTANQDEKIETKQEEAIVIEKKIVESEKKIETEKPAETKNKTSGIVDKLVSWGFEKADSRKIDTVIVHSSYNSLGGDVYDPDKIIAIYKQYEVSAHYLIARDGTAYRLVEEKNIAWHAGVSKVPDGRTNTNDFSIGIEMINTMDGKYTDAQYSTLNRLIGDLKKKYEIKYILGHNEIAPGRKTDPWNIDWARVQK